MNLYASTTLFWGQPLETIFQKVQDAELQGIELWMEQMQLENWSLPKIEQLMQQYNLAVSIHARSWDLNLASLNEEIRNASVHEIMNALYISKALNCPSVTIHPGRKMIASHPSIFYEQAMDKSLKTLYKASKKIGVSISLELLEELPKELYFEPEALNRLLEKYPSFKTTFDIAHIGLQDNIEEKLCQLHNIDKIHISDATEQKFHVALGTGQLRLPKTLWHRIEEQNVPVVLEGLCYDDTMFTQHLNYLKKLEIINHELFSYK
ncbi:MAG: TIM barrel protein [Solibacillus isronensis]